MPYTFPTRIQTGEVEKHLIITIHTYLLGVFQLFQAEFFKHSYRNSVEKVAEFN